jgi:hypothetical protein
VEDLAASAEVVAVVAAETVAYRRKLDSTSDELFNSLIR